MLTFSAWSMHIVLFEHIVLCKFLSFMILNGRCISTVHAKAGMQLQHRSTQYQLKHAHTWAWM